MTDCPSASNAGMFIQDSPHTFENQQAEFALAMAHAADPIVLLDAGGADRRAGGDMPCTQRRAAHPQAAAGEAHIRADGHTDLAVIAAHAPG